MKAEFISTETTGVKGSERKIKRGLEQREEGNTVSHGDEVIILFRDGYIRDYRKFYDDANINISFGISTGGKTFSYSLGLMQIQLGQFLPIKNKIILPITKIEDYFSITANVIQQSKLKQAQEKIDRSLGTVNTIVGNMPAIATAGSAAVGIVGGIINLIVALSPESALISEERVYIVDKNRYPDIGLEYLRFGKFDLFEDAYYYKDGQYYNLQNDRPEEPTRLSFELIKPRATVQSNYR
ncbi:MAG TPA: hypothetical protein VN703_01660 [Candidatus Sulfopaludibacter sp.]|nr:hypothetical protein [Candidatus Sulfopaludibacter sp.]